MFAEKSFSMVAIRWIDPIAFSGIGAQSEGLLRAGEDAKHRGGELPVAIERRTNGCERPQQSPRLFSVFSCCEHRVGFRDVAVVTERFGKGKDLCFGHCEGDILCVAGADNSRVYRGIDS